MNPLLIRRRGMMTAGGGGYIDWLRSLGCIVYLPLSFDGDLTDRISGNSLVATGYGSISWVNGIGYKIKTGTSTAHGAAELADAIPASSFPDECYTTLTTFEKITTSGQYGYEQIGILSSVDSIRTALSPMYDATGNIVNYPSGVLKLARYEGTDERNFYQNGALYTTLTPAPQILPSNWSQISTNLGIGTVRQINTVYTNREFYLSEVYVFNKKLTLDQIRTIQGY